MQEQQRMTAGRHGHDNLKVHAEVLTKMSPQFILVAPENQLKGHPYFPP